MTVVEGSTYLVVEPRVALLQWGRNLTVAEGVVGAEWESVLADASMGPQLDSCGRLRHDLDARIESHKLQWGRNLTVAEGQGRRRPRPNRRPLQWGRNLTVAEGVARCLRVGRAALLQWGRNLTVAEGGVLFTPVLLILLLQWGRNLTVAEGSAAISWAAGANGFNGAAT